MIVREATTQDVPELTDLWLAMAAEKPGFSDPDQQAWFDQQIRGIEAGTVLCVVARAGLEAVGFADGGLVYEPGDRTKKLVGRHLFVRNNFRGQSIGERLMLRLLALSRQSGASSFLTHGTPSRHAVEKFLGAPMTKEAEMWIARW